MRKFALALCILFTLCAWLFLLSLLNDAFFASNRAIAEDWGFAASVALEAVFFPVACLALYRDLRDYPAGLPPLAGPGDPDYEAVQLGERLRKRRLWALTLVPFCLVGGCSFFEVQGMAQRMKAGREFNLCRDTKQDLDPAIADFVKANRRPPKSFQELVDAKKLPGGLPVCPGGGVYSFARNPAGAIVAACSIHGSLDQPVVPRSAHD